VYVSLYGDENAVHERRRGNVMGLYGAYASINLENRKHPVRPLAHLPPGADAVLLWFLTAKPTGQDPVRKPRTGCGATQRRKNTNAWITGREAH